MLRCLEFFSFSKELKGKQGNFIKDKNLMYEKVVTKQFLVISLNHAIIIVSMVSQYFYNTISSLYDMRLHYYFRFSNPKFLLGKQYYSVFCFKLDFFWQQCKFAVAFLSNQKLFSTGFYKYTNLCNKLQILVTTNSIFCNRNTRIQLHQHQKIVHKP